MEEFQFDKPKFLIEYRRKSELLKEYVDKILPANTY